MRAGHSILLLVTSLVMIALVRVTFALAHDEAEWIGRSGLRNSAGEYCCGRGDCVDVTRQVSEVRGGYRVQMVVTAPYRADARAIDEVVPHGEVMPSPDHKFWRCQRPDGTRRCFFAPQPTT